MTNTRSLNYGFRWQFLLFPFLPTLLMCKYIALMVWAFLHLLRSVITMPFQDDGDNFGAYYSSRYKTCVVLGLFAFLFILFYWFIIPKFQE